MSRRPVRTRLDPVARGRSPGFGGTVDHRRRAMGARLRSILFWSHLIVGLGVGTFVLIMSATGVVLTYERQIAEWAEQREDVAVAESAALLSLDQLIAQSLERYPEEDHIFIRVVNRQGAAIPVWAGPNGNLIHPVTGDVLRAGRGAVGEFFDFVTRLHRWLAVEGKRYDAARAVMNYCNLLFLFLIVSGIYLWLPRLWRWSVLRSQMLLNRRAVSSKARDYNWHHVFGFWALPPLLFIALSATVLYFPWAVSALYGAYGESAPAGQERGAHDHGAIIGKTSYASMLATAVEHAHANGARDWYSIWVETGSGPDQAEFYIDRSIGNRPQLAYELKMNINSGRIIEVKRHNDWSPADQAWDLARFGHTGEWWGVAGQTIAGLASLAACILVYTGMALAWRRLVGPRLRRAEKTARG
ncbi:MAG: PepSY-associated TM helix domain-containing protein [Pseudomonadota bacterium]